LAGHRHSSAEYAPQEVALFEALRHETARGGWHALGAARLIVPVTESRVPIRKLYIDMLAARGFNVTTTSMSGLCLNMNEVVRATAKSGCAPFLLAFPLTACNPRAAAAKQGPVVVLRYDQPCAANRVPAANPSPSPILLPGG